jgi:hypothetical protein
LNQAHRAHHASCFCFTKESSFRVPLIVIRSRTLTNFAFLRSQSLRRRTPVSAGTASSNRRNMLRSHQNVLLHFMNYAESRISPASAGREQHTNSSLVAIALAPQSPNPHLRFLAGPRPHSNTSRHGCRFSEDASKAMQHPTEPPSTRVPGN